jgi:subtilisin family serine protease
VIVAVLDTGVDLTHPDLKRTLVPGATFIDGTMTAQDDNGHGTQVAGVAAAAANGYAGAGATAGIMPVKVATAEGHTDDEDGNPRVAAGIRWAADHGARIIAFSLGAGDNASMRAAVDYAYRRNVLIVAASGNSGTDRSPYPGPAYFPHVLAVGGTDERGRRQPFSTYGMRDLVMAPTVGVRTTQLGGGYATGAFTSIAAPQVAGLAALLVSLRPDLSIDQLIALIESGADPIGGQRGWHPKVGYGRVNVSRSLQLALALPTPQGHGSR